MNNDIERQNFWTIEMDEYIKSIKKWEPIMNSVQLDSEAIQNKNRAFMDHLEILKNNISGVPNKFFGK